MYDIIATVAWSKPGLLWWLQSIQPPIDFVEKNDAEKLAQNWDDSNRLIVRKQLWASFLGQDNQFVRASRLGSLHLAI